MKKFKKVLAAIMLMTAVAYISGCTKEGNKDVKVTTNTPQNITQTSATISGEVEVVTEGINITEKGVCWGSSKNPTVNDNHLASDGRGVTVTCTITGLEPGTTYHVRVYATDGSEYYYGDDKSFTTKGNPGGGGTGDHAWVDLGLPSGTLWATCNVGANSPEEYGDYFAWGEIQPKTDYSWNNYKYCNGNNQFTKYCNRPTYGYNGFSDDLTTLQLEDDAATANWGSNWCTPSREQWIELYGNTTTIWTTQNNVNGRLFTAENGSSIFLPAAGFMDFGPFGCTGEYWSNLLNTGLPSDARYFHFSSEVIRMDSDDRYYGQSVRPVRSAR